MKIESDSDQTLNLELSIVTGRYEDYIDISQGHEDSIFITKGMAIQLIEELQKLI